MLEIPANVFHLPLVRGRPATVCKSRSQSDARARDALARCPPRTRQAPHELGTRHGCGLTDVRRLHDYAIAVSGPRGASGGIAVPVHFSIPLLLTSVLNDPGRV